MMWSNSIADAANPVGIVGAGLMGGGIAQAVAAAGRQVVLCARNTDRASDTTARIRTSVERQVRRGRMSEDKSRRILDLISIRPFTPQELGRCGLVIESVAEDRSTKAGVLQQIEQAITTDTVVATNTSGLAVSGLATALRRPERFLGLHFFSPAERMPLVEVVRGRRTLEPALQDGLAFVKAIGKVPIVVRDGPSFFATRVFAAYLDEAVCMLQEGVEAERIEAAAIAAGRAIGPLATLDETGIALNLQQARQARTDGQQARFCRPLAEPVLKVLVESGRCGRGRGGGFYDWPASGERKLWAGLVSLYPRADGQPDTRTVKLRLLAAEAREAMRCLEEGTISSADDADTASVLGLGFPKSSGGIASWIEAFGINEFVELCARFAAAHGERFAPSPWLRELARDGTGLSKYRKTESES
ncbi:3-hydroxyacyl-CoA dehydrogenase [Bradyrhizobium diversitatis]|uniref:NAD(P)-binding domain-containing protein n=1 Tax=Bradyrhizobium diversitatis TaxID=2755406 RepID=A0ABS0PCF7_9BRAD|nr:3-hydroxyacyl-CoA dehydrogenase [Bradyrhizobium diversitatis]MBH5390819.1 NAD(P)-binding domain-containing protein [Bradyrhizobium diversitatis]